MMLRVTKKLYSVLEPKQKAGFIGLLFMMFIGGLLESVSVTVILPLISAVMDAGHYRDAWYASLICDIFNIRDQRSYVILLIIALIAIFVLKNIYILLQSYVQATFIGRCRFSLQSDLIDSYMEKPYSFFLDASTGEIVRIISNDTMNTFNLMSNTLVFYSEIIVFAILAVTVFVMSPVMALGISGMLLAELLIITLLIRPYMRRFGEAQRQNQKAANKWVLQSINGIKSIKVSDKTNFFKEKYKKHAGNVVEYERRAAVLNAMPRSVIEAMTVSGVLIMMLIMLSLGADGSELVPQLGAFVVAAVRLLPGANRISLATNGIANVEGALDSILSVLEKGENKPGNAEKDESDITFDREMRLEDVSFSYERGNTKILDCADLVIEPGQSVGIIGTSGGGKTTTVDIILGLLKPQNGKVTSDGRDINRSLHAWRAHLAYVPQSIFLTDDTVRNNVAFGVPAEEISDELVWEALREASLYDFVKSLPEGLDTGVGEAGVKLSGGQKQRIGIARALYDDPEIIVFDEATSALDGETEADIMESIDSLKGKKTLIIIAHRLSTTENCDVIYRLENGKLVKK